MPVSRLLLSTEIICRKINSSEECLPDVIYFTNLVRAKKIGDHRNICLKDVVKEYYCEHSVRINLYFASPILSQID